ncbi:MAG TPA: FtsX-like permease family protein [Candidatus Acidoferrales bacterium]|nr:FtsX-like permease family protein [Candidatus Acidoferrales bacterium]
MSLKTLRDFSTGRLLWNNVLARPLRSTLSAVAIALQVSLVLLIVGLTTGVVVDWGKRVEGVGADIMVQPPNSSIFFAFTGAVLPESIRDSIAQIPGVDEVSPVLIVTDTRTLGVVYGIDYSSFNALSKGFLFRQGHPFQGPDEAIADDLVAGAHKIKVGDQVNLLGHEFVISGIVEHGKGARYYVPLRTAQDLAGADKRVSLFYVRSRGDTEGTRAELVKLLPSYRIRSMAEYLTLMNTSNLPELKPFIRSMVGLGVAISFLVVLLTMHTMVLERTREIGILKALGFSQLDIVRLMVGETLVMTALGVALGLVATYSAYGVLKHTSPTLSILIPLDWVFRAMFLALVGAVSGALYPAFRAARFDPVDALAYE